MPQNETAQEILAELLAATDAIWLPNRGSIGRGVCCVRRREYHKRGIPWRSGALTVAGRKAAQRALESLVDGGLVEPVRSGSGRITHVRLTVEGEAEARRLCGLPGADLAYQLVQNFGEGWGKGRVHEKELALAFGLDDNWPKSCCLLEDMMLPLLLSGEIEADNIEHAGQFRIGYRLTVPLDKIREPDPSCEQTGPLKDAYRNRLRDELEAASNIRGR